MFIKPESEPEPRVESKPEPESDEPEERTAELATVPGDGERRDDEPEAPRRSGLFGFRKRRNGGG